MKKTESSFTRGWRGELLSLVFRGEMVFVMALDFRFSARREILSILDDDMYDVSAAATRRESPQRERR